MNVSSSLAGRLGVKNQKLGRIARPSRPSDVSRIPSKTLSGPGGALAHRLGVPVSTVGSSLSVGIRARLGVGARRAVLHKPVPEDDQFYSPYPAERRINVGAVSAERRRKNIRTADLAARRGIQAGGVSRAVLPARVKMSSGRVVGGMRSDLIREPSVKKKKRLLSSSPRQGARPVVAMDATRGLTVSLHNSRRRAPSYSQHDDRALPHAKSARGLNWDSEDDVDLQFQGRRSHGVYGGDAMDVDSGVGVYNASLLFTTRTTTHHHHHHHHGPPSPSPPPARPRPAVPMRARSPSPSPYHRDLSPRRGAVAPARHMREGRYLSQQEPYYSEDYSPPPPPSPPSFHPRYRARDSPPPTGYTSHKAVRPAPKPTKLHAKPSKAVKRTKLMKPSKKSKKIKAGKNLKSKKMKQLRSNRSSSLDTVSSNSDSSSSSSSSDSSSSSRNPRLASYKAPKERVLPEPHKQVLDPQVRKSIASLQGKDPESKSGPGPGIKDLVFVPSKTNKSLNQRFTFSDPSR